jgi:neutral ceramidase
MNQEVYQRFLLGLVVAAAAAVSAMGAEPAEHVFRAGAATSNITPPLDEPIVGNWGQPLARDVHDELHVRCLVLDDGMTQLAFVIVDNIGMPREVHDAAKRLIQDKTGIPANHVMCACTHTHSSISARGKSKMIPRESFGDYQKFVIRRMAEAVRRAVNNLEPARIGWDRGHEPDQVFNRRYFMKPGTPTPNPFGGTDRVVMNPGRGNPNIDNAAGPTDPEVSFLAVQSRDGRPVALLANYALHYVGPGVSDTISADYFGVFADRIQELLEADRHDPPFVGILSNGASADINNINWPQRAQQRPARYEQMTKVAHDVAQTVHQAYQATEFHEWVQLGAEQSEITLAVRKPTPEQVAYAETVLKKLSLLTSLPARMSSSVIFDKKIVCWSMTPRPWS